MHFAFTEEQEALRRTARRFLGSHSTSSQVRAAMATEAGYDPELYRHICQELGWTSLLIPESYGGLGGSYVELVGLMEEMGRALLCAPFFSTVCLATNVLLAGGSEAQQREHLPAIAAGKITATLAHTEPGGGAAEGEMRALARRDRDGYVLNGVKAYVVDGHTADLLIVAARLPAGEDGDAPAAKDSEELALFLVPGREKGVRRKGQETLDLTRKLAEVRLEEVRVPSTSRLGEAPAWAGIGCLKRALDLACVALSAEQVGGAQRCLDMAVDYAKVRVQFDRPIGSFQAIKHKCADMLLEVESARSASYYAGWAAHENPGELPLVAPLAKAFCSEAYFHCAAENIQIHGGIGFTWEHDAHLFFRRAKSSELLLGEPAYHREVLARRLGLLPAGAA